MRNCRISFGSAGLRSNRILAARVCAAISLVASAVSRPQVDPGLVAAAEIWGLPMMSAEAVAFIAVWGGQILCGFLVAGFLTRLSGLGLLLGILAYLIWVSPLAWPIAIVHGAAAFYLFARGGGAFSIDGAIVATAR